MKATPVIQKDSVKVHMEEPILVDQAPPEAMGWGRYRMPKVYRLPGGELCLTFSMSIDHYFDEGRTSPAFVSCDEGQTWQRTDWPHPGISGMNPLITAIHDGEYYCLPAGTGIQLDLNRLPEPVGTYMNSFMLYRLKDCPEDVIRWFKDLKAVRWSPRTKLWTEESVQWDHRRQLIFCYNDRPQNIPGDWSQKVYMESPIIRTDKELLYTDYWTVYENESGRLPQSWECSLMVSSDNAHSWTRRSTIAAMPTGNDMCEPVIEMNQAGELVCVMRVEGNNPRSMYLVHSKDNGYTWSEPQTILGYGVFPRLLQLENGIMVLAYGRSPGTWISFSLDGGYSWTQPQVILDETGKATSCGYTSMVALDRDTFLLAYGDIHFPNAKGEPCKSILVRQITVSKR